MIVGNNTKELDYDMRVCDGMETTSLMPEDGFIQFSAAGCAGAGSTAGIASTLYRRFFLKKDE